MEVRILSNWFSYSYIDSYKSMQSVLCFLIFCTFEELKVEQYFYTYITYTSITSLYLCPRNSYALRSRT